MLGHQQFPWIPVWDDHGKFGVTLIWKLLTETITEVANNAWRADSSELNNTEDSLINDRRVSVDQRKMNAH